MACGGTLCLLLSSLFLPSALVESSNCRFDADTYTTLHPATAFTDTWKEDRLRSGPFPSSLASPKTTQAVTMGATRLTKLSSPASPDITQDEALIFKRLAKHLSPASPETTQDSALGSERLSKLPSPASPETNQTGALRFNLLSNFPLPARPETTPDKTSGFERQDNPPSPASPETSQDSASGSKRPSLPSPASPEEIQDGIFGSKRPAKPSSPYTPDITQDDALGFKRLAKHLLPASPETSQEGALLSQPPIPAPIRWLCFNDTRALCWCTVSQLDCSDNNGSLTFVPEVEGNFTFLNFTYNSLQHVPEDFFHNVTRISRLDLGDNHNLSFIDPRAFQPLRELRELFLDYAYALTKDWVRLEPVFSVRTLTRLDLRVGDLPPLPPDLFYRHPLPRLETLYFHYNKLQHINMTALRPLSSLKTFGAASNQLAYIVADFAPALQKLNLRYNSLTTFPYTCHESGDGTRRSYYPKLTQILLMDNRIKYIHGTVCLPLLSYLDLSKNHIRVVSSGMFSAHRFPGLEELYLQDMPYLSEIHAGAFASPALRTLSVMYNNFYFSPRNVSAHSFRGLPGLQNLLLGHNHISHQNFVRIFRHLLPSLRYIHLGSNSIQGISKETFSGFMHLSKLCMYQNQVTALPEGAFDSLTQLSTLDINDNLIVTVPPSAFSPATRQRLNHTDLSQNPFRCDCNILWFKTWLQSSPLLFSHSRGAYECRDVHQTKGGHRLKVVDFSLPTQACLLDHKTSVFIVAVMGLVVSVIAVVAPCYRYRWHLRLLWHQQFRGGGRGGEGGRNRRSRRAGHDADKQYDVFVSYAQRDLAWVLQALLPQLEGRLGLRLFVMDRDSVPGRLIAEEILRGIEASRRVLMVFSRTFARDKDKWCQFQLAQALRHVLETDDALEVVCLDDVTRSRHLPLQMLAVFRILRYIEWGEGSEARASFWGRLEVSFGDLIQLPT